MPPPAPTPPPLLPSPPCLPPLASPPPCTPSIAGVPSPLSLLPTSPTLSPPRTPPYGGRSLLLFLRRPRSLRSDLALFPPDRPHHPPLIVRCHLVEAAWSRQGHAVRALCQLPDLTAPAPVVTGSAPCHRICLARVAPSPSTAPSLRS
jgi:hypothetical protein